MGGLPREKIWNIFPQKKHFCLRHVGHLYARAFVDVTINYVETPQKHLNSLFLEKSKKSMLNDVEIIVQIFEII